MIIRKALIVSIFFITMFFINIVHGESVKNGRYYGALLSCDDGYRSSGGQCVALPTVTNGR